MIKFGYISNNKINKIRVVNKLQHQETVYDYYIGRPSILSNPFSHKKSKYAKYFVDTRKEAISKYEDYFYSKLKSDIKFKNEIDKLIKFYKEKGKINLICFCKPKPCHGDIIKDYIIKYLKKSI